MLGLVFKMGSGGFFGESCEPRGQCEVLLGGIREFPACFPCCQSMEGSSARLLLPDGSSPSCDL